MEYIRVISKQLARALNGCSLEKELRRPVLGKRHWKYHKCRDFFTRRWEHSKQI